MKKPTYFRSLADGHIIETNHPEHWSNPAQYERIEHNAGKVLIQEQARDYLLGRLSPGQTVYSQIVSVSSSGMSRSIKFYCIANGELLNITNNVSRLLGHKMHKNGGLIVNGCGMDMAFSTVYNLGRVLWETEPGQRDAGYSLKSQII